MDLRSMSRRAWEFITSVDRDQRDDGSRSVWRVAFTGK